MQLITTACTGNMELQQILVNTIKQYEAAKETGELQAFLQPKKRQKKEVDPAPDPDMLPDKDLNRNQSMFLKWGAPLLKHMLYFAHAGDFNWDTLQSITVKDRLLEIIEYCWDFKIFSLTPDRLNNLKVETLFPSFRQSYLDNGVRFHALKENMDAGHIDWKVHGHYSVRVITVEGSSQEQLEVTSKTLKQTVLVPVEVTSGDSTLSTFVIKQNFSQHASFLQTATDTYLCASFFPLLGRTIRRRNSEEQGLVSRFSGGSRSGSSNVEPPSRAGPAARRSSLVGSAAAGPVAASGREDLGVPAMGDEVEEE
jgi:hypothetical protein